MKKDLSNFKQVNWVEWSNLFGNYRYDINDHNEARRISDGALVGYKYFGRYLVDPELLRN